MMIKILDGERFGESKEMDIDKFHKVIDARVIICRICQHVDEKRKYFLIYNNIILNDDYIFGFYKVSPGGEIWCGKIEKYLQYDNVILEVFLVETFNIFVHLIMKRQDLVSRIKSILDGIIPPFVKVSIWNYLGDCMKDEHTIGDVDPHGKSYKIILGWQEEGAGRSFDECCDIHDQNLVEEFMIIRNWNNETVEMKEQMAYYGEIILSLVSTDSRLLERLATFPASFLDSKCLFCTNMANRILEIFDGHDASVKRKYSERYKDLFELVIGDECFTIPFKKFHRKFTFAIRVAALDYLDREAQFPASDNQSYIGNIAYGAAQYLINPKIWLDSTRLILDRFLLKSRGDLEISEMSGNILYLSLPVKMQGLRTFIRVPHQVQTVFDAKTVISRQMGVSLPEVYVTEYLGEAKPINNNIFDVRTIRNTLICFAFEVMPCLDNVDQLKPLGKGGFGNVFLCQDKISKKIFALKKPLETADLYREISVHTRIAYSDSLSACIGLYRDGPLTCIAMEYFSGGTLSAYIQQKQILAESEIADISHQILKQIAELHRRNLIHRDIKPENIVFADNQHVKLLDFGLSKCFFKQKSEDLMKNLIAYKPGTIYYMAPELLNRKIYTEKIDTWSFGATVIEMLSGKMPYYNLKPMQAAVKLARLKKIEYQAPYQISRELECFLNLCLDPDPNERATIKQLVESDFILKYLTNR